MTDFKDYDALAAERQAFVRRIGGRDIEFRKVLPAKLVLDIRRRATKSMTDDEAESFGFDLIEEIIGAEDYAHITAHLGIDHLGELVADVMAYYGLSGDDEGKAGEPATEEPGSPSGESSPDGEPSTPTSNGSTPTPEEASTTEPSTGTLLPADSGSSPLALTS